MECTEESLWDLGSAPTGSRGMWSQHKLKQKCLGETQQCLHSSGERTAHFWVCLCNPCSCNKELGEIRWEGVGSTQ